MRLTEFRLSNGPLSLNGITNNGTLDKPPILFIPGLWGNAEQFSEVLRLLGERKAYALSLRGRGLSDIPDSGYTLEDHVSDIKACAYALSLEKFFLVTVSAGASYAIAFAAHHGDLIVGLVVTDYPPILKNYPPEMVEGVLRDIKDIKISEKFLRGLQRESHAADLSPELRKITCPVTIFRGGKTGSFLNETHLSTYRENLMDVSFETLQEVAHDPLLAPECFVQSLLSQI